MKNKMLKKYQEILTRTAATVLLFVLVFQPFLVLADEAVSGTSSVVQESSTSTEQGTGVGSDGDYTQNVNQPPVIQSVSWDQSAAAGVPETFTVNATDDQTSSADLWYSVDWNDGSNTALSKGQNVLSHTFAAAGTYNVVFTVAESDQPNAGLHSYSVTVSVVSPSSISSSTDTDTSSSSEQETSSTTASTSTSTASTSTASTTSGTEQTGIPHISSIAGSTTVYAGENNLFTIYATDKDGQISSNLVYKVDWGDDASTTFQDHPTFAHVYSSAGVYNITFTVMDRNDGGVDSYTQRIEVVGTNLNLQNSETADKLDNNKSSDSARTSTIHVTSPNGGEFYSVGTVMHITWEDAYSSPNSRYNIFLIKDGKQHLIDYGVATGTQYYDWKIPSSFIDRWDNKNELVNIVSGKIYHIRVCPIDSILCDASDASFTITNEAASESPSWCGLYYDYKANDTGMNLPGNQWPDKIDIGPQDPNWNSSRFSYWYSNDRFATSSYKTTLTDGSFFPLDYLGADDPSGSSTHNFHFGAHFISYASVEQEGDYRYTLLSDDDSFLYVDNVLKENRSGLVNESESMRRGTLHMVPGHLYRIDIYFAERHEPGSAIYFYFNKTDQNGNDINEGDPRVTLTAPNTCARPGSANPAILPESLPNGVVGTNYGTTTFTPTGFLAPTSSLVWTVSEGSLPPGLTLIGDKIGGIPTTVGTYTFTIMASTTGEFATRTYTINVTSNTNTNPGSGSNPGSGGGGERRGGGYIPLVPTVLGTSTVATGPCEVYLHKYIKYGAKNDPAEVRKLQAFLRVFEKRSDIAVTGVYDYKTYMAVKDFQKKYMKGVLAPWGISEPTGYVFITTTLKINMLYCGFSTDVKLNLRNFYKNEINTDGADSNYEASNAVQSTSASLTLPVVATTSIATTEVATVTKDLTRNLTAGGFGGLSTCSALSWFPWLIVVLLVIYIIWDHGRREDEKSVEKIEKK